MDRQRITQQRRSYVEGLITGASERERRVREWGDAAAAARSERYVAALEEQHVDALGRLWTSTPDAVADHQ